MPSRAIDRYMQVSTRQPPCDAGAADRDAGTAHGNAGAAHRDRPCASRRRRQPAAAPPPPTAAPPRSSPQPPAPPPTSPVPPRRTGLDTSPMDAVLAGAVRRHEPAAHRQRPAAARANGCLVGDRAHPVAGYGGPQLLRAREPDHRRQRVHADGQARRAVRLGRREPREEQLPDDDASAWPTKRCGTARRTTRIS